MNETCATFGKKWEAYLIICELAATLTLQNNKCIAMCEIQRPGIANGGWCLINTHQKIDSTPEEHRMRRNQRSAYKHLDHFFRFFFASRLLTLVQTICFLTNQKGQRAIMGRLVANLLTESEQETLYKRYFLCHTRCVDDNLLPPKSIDEYIRRCKWPKPLLNICPTKEDTDI